MKSDLGKTSVAAGYAGEVVVLGASPDAAPDGLGGKGARIHEMAAAGLPVPPAFCLRAGLLTRFLDETGLARRVGDQDLASTRKMIMSAPMPAPIADVILDAYHELDRPRVAVRSSALAEDSAELSYAGQHDTLLDVSGDEALLEAVKACWASLWTRRAAAYADGPRPAFMAVVVQEMVQAEVSGVLFTVDPVSGGAHRMIVEACHGLGEGLVSGRVSGDLFVIDDRTLDVVEERVRYKVTKCAPMGAGRIGMTKVDPAARNAPCLNPGQLRELAALGKQLRQRYGCEQDIEWALCGNTFAVLQARPITTRPAGVSPSSPYVEPQDDAVQRGTLWSRMDVGEIFVGQMTPLGLSFARHHQRHVHGDCASAVGVRDVGDHNRYMGYLQGHVYLNISYTAYLLGQCPPTKDQSHFTERFASEEVDLARYRNPFGDFPGGMAGTRSVLYWISRTSRELLEMRHRAEQMTDARLSEFDRVRGIDLTRMSRHELRAELERYLVHYHDMHVGYLPFYINGFTAYGLMKELCAKWLGSEGDNLQNRVKTDMSNLRTVASAREVKELARAARRKPRVMRLISDTPLDGVETALRNDPDGKAFWDAHIDPFLRVNGVRGHQEMELTNPRWVDDPSYILQMIRCYAEEGVVLPQSRDSDRDKEDPEQILEGLPRVRRKILKRIIALYTTCSELREVARMAMITSLWTTRRLVYEVGRRLVDEGVLRSLDEVSYLEIDDIRSYLSGTAPAREHFPRARIDAARRVHEYHKRLPEPPLTFIGEYDMARAGTRADADAVMDGVAASAGKSVGRARIIEDLAWQADEFQPGEILIARYTDASWTPLFAIAGGVVTDIGSMLSHSSIVAREFSVPSVVNTKHATQRINTGDMVMIDGDAGTVEVISAS